MANCNYKVNMKDIQNKYKFKIFGLQGPKGETGEIGTPLVASSISGMTDTTRNYINTTNGHWYWYNGTTWVDGGVYQATEDSETLDNLNNKVTSILPFKTIDIGTSEDWEVGMYSTNGSFNSGATYARTTDYLSILPNHYLYLYQPNQALTFRVAFFDITKKLLGEVLNYATQSVDEYILIPKSVYYVRVGTTTAGLPNVVLKMETLKDDEKYSNLVVNCLGDSLTRGYISATDPKFMNYPMPNQLKILMGFNNVRNYGQSGTCLSNNTGYYNDPMCTRYVNMENADIVLVMGGTNDMLTNVPLGTINDFDSDESTNHTFYGGLNRLAQGLINKYQTYNPTKKTKVIFITFPQNSYVQSHKTEYLQYNQAIRDVCARYSLPVIDLAKELGLSYLYTGTWTVGDGTHFSQDTVTNIFTPYIAQKLKEILY